MNLSAKHCVPCEGGVPPLAPAAIERLLTELGHDWALVNGSVTKQFDFEHFLAAIAFINQISSLAETEGHHPDLTLHDYRFVTVSSITHAINGLSENDFILAAKIQATFDAEQP